MIMLIRTMNFSSASQVLSLIGPERHTARPLPDGTRADLAAVSPVAHSLTSVPFPPTPDGTSGNRRLVPIGAAVTAHPRSHRRLDPERALVVRSDRHRADWTLDPTAMKGQGDAWLAGASECSVLVGNARQTNVDNRTDRTVPCDLQSTDERRPQRGCIHTRIADTSGMPWPPRHHLTLNVSAMPTLAMAMTTGHHATTKGTLVRDMGTPPKLHHRLLDGIERVQDTFDSVVAPDSDGGISITPFEMLRVNAELREVVPLVNEAADTLRLLHTAAGTGVSSAWLAKRMDEHIDDLKVINMDRYRSAQESARLIVLEDYRGEGNGPRVA